MKVVNQCYIKFCYRYSEGSPVITETVLSNLVSTEIINNIIKITKSVNKKIASTFEILTYTITISNISNLSIHNIFFKDNIPAGTKFIDETVFINGVRRKALDPQRGFCLGDLSPNKEIVINFKVVIVQNKCVFNIKNYSKIKYDYIYNIEKPPFSVELKSNKVVTKVDKNLFKQISISNDLKLSCFDVKKDKIRKVIGKARILKAKIIGIYYDDYSKKFLYRLILIGKIKYDIIYDESTFRKFERKYCKEVKRSYGFSTCIDVPVGIKHCTIKNIETIVEDISYEYQEKNIFISSKIFIAIV